MWIKDELVRHLTSGPQGWSITITYQTVFRSISRLLTGIIWSITCTRPLVAGMSPITWATPLTTTCSCVTVTNECCFEPKPSTSVLSWERGEEACGWKSPIMVSLRMSTKEYHCFSQAREKISSKLKEPLYSYPLSSRKTEEALPSMFLEESGWLHPGEVEIILFFRVEIIASFSRYISYSSVCLRRYG